jgi:hypothetical protein
MAARQRQYAPPKHTYSLTRLNDVTTQTTTKNLYFPCVALEVLTKLALKSIVVHILQPFSSGEHHASKDKIASVFRMQSEPRKE